jgi:hypothetical protein
MSGVKHAKNWLGMVGALIVIGLRPVEGWAAVTVTPALSVSERYSDNLFFSDTDPQNDFSTFIAPTVALLIDSQWARLTTRYLGYGEYHRRATEANGYSQGLAFDLDLPILSQQTRRMEVRVTENLTYTRELPAFAYGEGDVNVEANEGIQVPRSTTFRNRAGAEVIYSWSPRLATSIFYNYLLTRYEGALLDVAVHSAGLGGDFQISPRMAYSMSVGVAVQEFEDVDPVRYGSGSAGFSYQVTQTVSLDSQVGIAKIAQGATYTTGSVGARKAWERASASLRYLQEVGTGVGVAASATLSDLVVANASWKISRDVSANVDFAYGHNVSIPDRQQLDIVTYQVATRVSVSFSTWLGGGINYTYLAQDARATAGSDGRKNAVTLSLSATAPAWRLVK